MATKDDDGGLAVEDDFTAAIRATMDGLEAPEDEGDDGGLDQPLDDGAAADKVISAEEAANVIDAVRMAKVTKAPAKDAPAEVAKEVAKPEAEEEAAAEEVAAPDAPVDLTGAQPDALLEGVDPAKATELRRRMSAAQSVMRVFDNQSEMLARHGATPEQAISRLVEINNFAISKPDEYLAWVADQTKGDGQPHEMLEKAASRFGYKLVKAEPDLADGIDEEDDFFLDDRAKAILAENRQLKAAAAQIQRPAVEFGPDAPQEVIAREVTSWANEVGPDGKPLRPLLDYLAPQIAQRAAQHATSGTRATLADLTRFYDEAAAHLVGSITPAAAPQITPAAQAPAAVQQQIDNDAERVAKAKRASKSVDGSGQSADHRPVVESSDDPIAAIVRKNWNA